MPNLRRRTLKQVDLKKEWGRPARLVHIAPREELIGYIFRGHGEKQGP